MKLVFLTLVEINSIEERGIYQDLLRKFRAEGHDVTVVTPVERRKGVATNFQKKEGISVLQVRTFNIQKTNIVEKGIGTLSIEYQFLHAIKKHLANQSFDLILYSTPPITFAKVIEFVKRRDGAYSYLLLKDIFPQNAVDMRMLKAGSFLHRMFLRKEKKLYQISDTIGCMSPSNVDFVLKHNPQLNEVKVEVNPNSIEPICYNYTEEEMRFIREKYEIPVDRKVLMYGGNLGKPQGLDFLLETISATENEQAYFLIVGDGTEYMRMNEWFEQNQPRNAKLLRRLPKEDYDLLLAACDIGLIFLDKDFLIPNFPSRLLSYLEMKMPVIAATDSNTDIGDIIEKANCGIKVLAGNQKEMQIKLKKLLSKDLTIMGQNAERLLINEYTVDNSYGLIMNRINNV